MNNTQSEEIQKKIPKSYQSLPTILIGRLAVDVNFHGQGLGKLLLIDALKRCYENSKIVGSFVVIVHPINNDAENFYKKFDFIKLPDGKSMFIAVKTIEKLILN